MTWAQAMRDAVDFILEQDPNMDERTARYIATEILRMGEKLNANFRSRPNRQWSRNSY